MPGGGAGAAADPGQLLRRPGGAARRWSRRWSDRLRADGILYDEDEGGRYFQLYTRAFRERFFFEIVERDGYGGFGAPNAPIRLAAQARLARGAAIPRL